MTRKGTDNGDKWERWLGHLEHVARGIEFIPRCWVCKLPELKRYPAKQFPQKADANGCGSKPDTGASCRRIENAPYGMRGESREA